MMGRAAILYAALTMVLIGSLVLTAFSQSAFASPNPALHHGGAASLETKPSNTHGSSSATSPDVAWVKLGDEEVFSLEVGRGKRSAAERARQATRALEDALRENQISVSIAWADEVAVIRARERFIVELTDEDRAASNHASLRPYAEETAQRIRNSLQRESERRSFAARVLSVSSVVFLGLLAWLAMGFAGRFAHRTRRYIERSRAGSRGIHIQEVELVPAEAVREGLRLLVWGGLWAVRLGLLYSWTLFALSLFAPTRDYASRATGYLFTPAIDLLGRLAARLPLLLALAFALIVVLLVVRLVRLYFDAVERGTIENGWLRRETAGATSTLIVVAICLASLLFVTPLLAGSADGVLTRVGLLGVGAIALGATPVLVSCLLGMRMVYGRTWSVGDLVDYGGESGWVMRMDLFDAMLKSKEGVIVRVPHLMSLWHPTRIYPGQGRASPSSDSAPLS